MLLLPQTCQETFLVVSKDSTFQCIRLSGVQRFPGQSVIEHRSLTLHVSIPFVHLSAFPLCLAFPGSLVGHDSHEYYADSVTLGLTACRPSRIPLK